MRSLALRLCPRLSDVGPPEAWAALRARPPASLTASRPWVTAAFEAAHRRATPFLLAVQDADSLVALLTLALHYPSTSPTLRFAGAPRNDMADAITLPGYEEQAAGAIIRELGRLGDRGLAVLLEAVDPRGVLATVDRVHPALRWHAHEPAPVIDLEGGWTSPPTARRRWSWERSLAQLRKTHAVEFRRLEGDALLAAFPDFAALRDARLRFTGRPLDRPPMRFVEDAVARLAADSACVLMEMRIDGRPVASDLYLVDRPVAMMWLRGLDPAWRRHPCGHLLLRESVQAFAAEGFEALDLGRGEEPYKLAFGGERRVLLRANI